MTSNSVLSKVMKIGLFLPSLLMLEKYKERIFAPKKLFLDLADALVDRGHKVYVYSTSDVKTRAEVISGDKILEKEDLQSKSLGIDKSWAMMRYKPIPIEYELDLTIKAFLHARKHGIALIHAYHDFMIRYMEKLVPDVSVVYTLHDPVPSPGTLEKWRLKQFADDFYIAISKHQARQYGDFIRKPKVIYHGIKVSEFPFSASGGRHIGFIGRLVPQKGAHEAIAASLELKIPLEIGTSPFYYKSDYFKKEIKPHLQGKLISLSGYLGGKRRLEWLKTAKAVLFPIRWDEPFGLVMIEGMACGTPVIAYNRGSVSEIVRDGVTGFIIEPEEGEHRTQSSMTKIKKGDWIIKKRGVLGLVEAMKRIGEIDREKCRRHVEENFSLERMVSEHEKLYQKITAADAKRPIFSAISRS